jgi:hypothetical protein
VDTVEEQSSLLVDSKMGQSWGIQRVQVKQNEGNGPEYVVKVWNKSRM